MGLNNAKPNSNKIYLGSGQVYIDRLDATGKRTGERFLGNVPKLTISTSEETKEIHSSVDGARALLAKNTLSRTAKASLSLNEVTQKNLALALCGTELTLSQTSGSFGVGAGDPVGSSVIQPQPTCQGGLWYPLAKRNVSAVTVKHTTITGTTLTAGTDYEIDTVRGRIFVVAGGAGDNKLLWAEYTYGTDTRNSVSAIDATVKAYMRFIADPSQGPVVEAEFWNCVLAPQGDLDLIGEDYVAFPIEVAILADTVNHPTEPFFRIVS